MNEQETIADIIAERRAFEFITSGMRGFKKINKEYKDYTDRLEAALKREREAITPKSDPDWKDICAKCKDGDIEPNYCEYYGEPNGCNSPIYGEHPTAKKSLIVGDCAKLREAALAIRADILKRRSENCWYATDSDILEKIDAALAAPPRNCDRFGGDIDKLREACARERGLNPEEDFPDVFPGWLLAPATKGGAK